MSFSLCKVICILCIFIVFSYITNQLVPSWVIFSTYKSNTILMYLCKIMFSNNTWPVLRPKSMYLAASVKNVIRYLSNNPFFFPSAITTISQQAGKIRGFVTGGGGGLNFNLLIQKFAQASL